MQRHWPSWTSAQHSPRMTTGWGCQRQLLRGLCKASAGEADRVIVGEPLCTALHSTLASCSNVGTVEWLAAELGKAAQAP